MCLFADVSIDDTLTLSSVYHVLTGSILVPHLQSWSMDVDTWF
jgi:hypothetical protein